MKLEKSQRGLTAIGWLLVILFVAFFGLFILRLVPVYLQSYTLSTIMENAAKADGDENDMPGGHAKLYDTIERRLEINDIEIVSLHDFKVVHDNAGDRLTLTYEQRTPFIGNIDLIVHFDKSVPIK
ncbi:MAG: DUF4845 domain-containing protein [Gammaproteobacteria bacterium]